MTEYKPRTTLPHRVRLTRAGEKALLEARVSFMRECPFYSYYFYDEMVEYYTDELPTLATDGRRLFINLDYLASLKPMERAFAYAHEVDHAVKRHPARVKHYLETGMVRGLPFNQKLMNICMDFPINAHLVEIGVGSCNPAWLYDPQINGDVLPEDLYVKWYRPPPPPPPGGGRSNPEGSPTSGSGPDEDSEPGEGDDQDDNEGDSDEEFKTYGDTQRPNGRSDKTARQQGGRFDEVLPPMQDPATGKDDLPSDMEFIEAVSRAAAAAKAAGKLPGRIQRMVEEITEPQVNWREHIRMVLTGKLGQRRETWEHPNRRRIVLNPSVYLPGKKGHGAEDVTVVIDNSGSIGEAELSAFFGEAGAIIADCRPRKVRVIWCDWVVQRVEEARSLDELAHIRLQGSTGGGGTSFRPPFEWLAERDITPDTLVYLTDLMGPFPDDEPPFPVVWCATTELEAPWGDVVRINV